MDRVGFNGDVVIVTEDGGEVLGQFPRGPEHNVIGA